MTAGLYQVGAYELEVEDVGPNVKAHGSTDGFTVAAASQGLGAYREPILFAFASTYAWRHV